MNVLYVKIIPFELPEEIIEAAIEGNLVLFCGAGISTEGKTVLPYSFYESIKNELEIVDDTISQTVNRVSAYAGAFLI